MNVDLHHNFNLVCHNVYFLSYNYDFKVIIMFYQKMYIFSYVEKI